MTEKRLRFHSMNAHIILQYHHIGGFCFPYAVDFYSYSTKILRIYIHYGYFLAFGEITYFDTIKHSRTTTRQSNRFLKEFFGDFKYAKECIPPQRYGYIFTLSEWGKELVKPI